MVDLLQEGHDTLLKTHSLFWDENARKYLNKNGSEGSYDQSGVYAVWPLSVMAQALVDGARAFPSEIMPLLRPTFQTFERYYNPKYKAYAASEYFDGNDDIYYDDNAQVASAFVTAYELTYDEYYYSKARENVEFLMTGWQNRPPHGIKWHLKHGPNTCSTAESGLAALRLARCERDENFRNQLVGFGLRCVHWIFDTLQDPNDGLIFDGFKQGETNEDGSPKIDDMKWTYNQGTPLSLAALCYSFSRDQSLLAKAQSLAMAVTDRGSLIFDRRADDHGRRYYKDGIFFYQLLAEGFADYHAILGRCGVSRESLDRTYDEAVREARYVIEYMKDTDSGGDGQGDGTGLYFQTFELFRIDEKRLEMYKDLTRKGRDLEPDEKERCVHEKDKPVEQRSLTHSMMANASAARVFFQTARLQREL